MPYEYMEMKITGGWIVDYTTVEKSVIFGFPRKSVTRCIVLEITKDNIPIKIYRALGKLKEELYPTKPTDKDHYYFLKGFWSRERVVEILKEALLIPAYHIAWYGSKWEILEDGDFKNCSIIKYTFMKAHFLRLDIKEYLKIYLWRGYGEWFSEIWKRKGLT